MRLSRLTCSRTSLVGLSVVSVLLSACAGDSTSPPVSTATVAKGAVAAVSPFVPTRAASDLVGVSDGRYEFTVDPRHDQALVLGANLLSLPANSICDLRTSRYGPTHWNERCAPQTKPVTITAIVKNARSNHPSIDFYPAMRFSPDKNVSIYFYVREASLDHDPKEWSVDYCNDARICIDESLTDPTLRTSVDRRNRIAFRRIKHFSGYIVVFALGEAPSDLL